MTTGAEFVNIQQKRLAGYEDFKDGMLDYLRTIINDNAKRTYDFDGTLATSKVTITGAGIDRISLGNLQKGADGQGHFIDPSQATVTNLQFQNTNAVTYYVGCRYAERPIGLQVNVSTGIPEFKNWKETIGERATPTTVEDNGNGTLTFVVDSVTEAGVSNAGRQVMVWKKVPGKNATTEALALETRTVTWDGANNRITTVGNFGQSTVSTTAADYEVLLIGPAIKRNTDLRASSNHWFIGTVTGNGSGNTPVTFSTTDQFLFTATLANISNITRVDSHGYLKVQVQADASDVDEPQITVRDAGGTVTFSIDEDGDVIFNGYYQGHVRPLTNNTYELGDATHRWSTVYMVNLNLSGHFLPATDAAQDIGSYTGPLRWRNGLFSTNLSVGPISAAGSYGDGINFRSYYPSANDSDENGNTFFFDAESDGASLKSAVQIHTRASYGSGTTGEMRGLDVVTDAVGGGNIDRVTNLAVQTSAVAGGITDSVGLHIKAASVTSGSIDNEYGIYIDGFTAGGQRWAVYQNGFGWWRISSEFSTAGNVWPETDGSVTLGLLNNKWSNVYSNNHVLRSLGPYLEMWDTGATTDNHKWRWELSGGILFLSLYPDSGGATSVLQMNRTGNTLTNTQLRSHLRPRTDASFDLGSAAARWATIYSQFMRVEHTAPEIVLKDTDAAADAKVYKFEMGVNALMLRAYNDVEGASVPLMSWGRSGAAASIIFAYNTIEPSSDSAFNLGSTSNQWSTLYVDTIHAYALIRPSADNTVDLGTSAASFRDLYLSRNADIEGTITWDGHRISCYNYNQQNTLTTLTGGVASLRCLNFDTDNETAVGITRTSGLTSGVANSDATNTYTRFTFSRTGRYQVTYSFNWSTTSAPTADEIWSAQAYCILNATSTPSGTIIEASDFTVSGIARVSGQTVIHAQCTFTTDISNGDNLVLGQKLAQSSASGGVKITRAHIEIIQVPVV